MTILNDHHKLYHSKIQNRYNPTYSQPFFQGIQEVCILAYQCITVAVGGLRLIYNIITDSLTQNKLKLIKFNSVFY